MPVRRNATIDHTIDAILVPTDGSVAELHDALEAPDRDALEAVSERAREAGVSVVGHIGSGPAARVILS